MFNQILAPVMILGNNNNSLALTRKIISSIGFTSAVPGASAPAVVKNQSSRSSAREVSESLTETALKTHTPPN